MDGRPTPQTALVTGASSGIGLDLARLLAKDKYNLILVARNADRLSAIAGELSSEHGIQARPLPLNLAEPGACDDLHRSIEALRIDVDVLVNNAGFGSHGPFSASDVNQELQMIQVNVVALTHLTRLFLPAMIARKSGKILNVASTAGFQPGPLMAVYYATKAYVLSFSEAIAAEVTGSGITVTTLCPGPTATDFHHRAKIENTPLFKANTMSSATVAKIGYRGMLKGRRIVVPGMRNKLMVMSVRISPRRLVTAVTRKLNSSR